MSRGLDSVEYLLFAYLRRRAASFAEIVNYALMYMSTGKYHSERETIRRALKSLVRKRYIERETYKGVVIYSVKKKT